MNMINEPIKAATANIKVRIRTNATRWLDVPTSHHSIARGFKSRDHSRAFPQLDPTLFCELLGPFFGACVIVTDKFDASKCMSVRADYMCPVRLFHRSRPRFDNNAGFRLFLIFRITLPLRQGAPSNVTPAIVIRAVSSFGVSARRHGHGGILRVLGIGRRSDVDSEKLLPPFIVIERAD